MLMPHQLTDTQKKLLKKLGARIKEIREEKGLSLQDVALTIDKDKQSIHALEKGSFNPSFVYLLDVCKGLNIDLADLIKDFK